MGINSRHNSNIKLVKGKLSSSNVQSQANVLPDSLLDSEQAIDELQERIAKLSAFMDPLPIPQYGQAPIELNMANFMAGGNIGGGILSPKRQENNMYPAPYDTQLHDFLKEQKITEEELQSYLRGFYNINATNGEKLTIFKSVKFEHFPYFWKLELQQHQEEHIDLYQLELKRSTTRALQVGPLFASYMHRRKPKDVRENPYKDLSREELRRHSRRYRQELDKLDRTEKPLREYHDGSEMRSWDKYSMAVLQKFFGKIIEHKGNIRLVV